MKKILLQIVFILSAATVAIAQPTFYYEAPPSDGGTSGNRSPNGTSLHAFMRGSSLIMASELTNVAVNTTLTSFGFTLNSGNASTAVTGNFTVYLQNTTDATYLKGTTWSTIITGMTTAYASTMTLPVSAGTTSVTVTLSTPFVYTGGGIYVAYDWASTGPFDATACIYRCNYLGLTGGCVSGASATTPPATLGTSNFRPCFLLGTANTFTNEIQYIGMEAPGRVSGMFNTPHNIRAIIKNASNQTQTNIVVGLNVTGANVFANTQTVSSLASGAVTTVTFAAFNPNLPGLNTLSVSLPPDQNNANNSGTYSQSVTCNEWAMNPANVSYTMGSVGFNTGSGIIAVSYSNPVTSTLTSLRGAVSTNTPAYGNASWGVLMSSAGVIIATTNTITLSASTAGSFVTFNFANPQSLTAGTNYYLGFAQPANTSLGYFPMGTYTSAYVPFTSYVTTSTVGGTPAPLTSNLGYFGIEAVFVPNLSLTATSPTVVCGAPATLTASSVGNYSWTSGPVNSSIVVSPTVNTTYTVSSSSTLGCLATVIVTVNVSPLPVSASSSTSSICNGLSVVITATGAPNYSWNAGPNPTSATFTDSPTSTTNYIVVGTNSAGCSSSSSVIVVVNTFSNLSVSTQSITTCLGNSVSIIAAGASSYTWDTGSNTSTNTVFNTIPSGSGVYTVTGADPLGCLDMRTVTVTVNSFTPGISSATAICVGNQITLNATGAAPNSYTWSNGSPFSGITITPNATAVYSVIAIGINGCVGYANTTVSVNPNPSVTATASRLSMCKGETNTLTATGASNYTWTGPVTGPTLVFTATVNLNLTYTVIGVDANGCSDTKTLNIVVTACTGIDSQLSNATIQVFPNPSNGIVHVQTENSNNLSAIKVVNSLGQTIKLITTIETNNTVDLSNCANGLYFIYLMKDDKTVQLTKIVKQ